MLKKIFNNLILHALDLPSLYALKKIIFNKNKGLLYFLKKHLEILSLR